MAASNALLYVHPLWSRTVAAEQFFRKILDASHMTSPCVITADKNPTHPPALEAFHHDRMLQEICQLRQYKYLNNILKCHRFITPCQSWLGFGTFTTAQRIIQGYETMHMLRKGQLGGIY